MLRLGIGGAIGGIALLLLSAASVSARAASTASVAAGIRRASANRHHRHRFPDLKITQFEIKRLPGEPPYVIEDESGHTPEFVVRVRTENVGNGSTKKESKTGLEVTTLNGTPLFEDSKPIRILDPGESSGKTFKVKLDSHVVPPLGLLRVVATANVTRTVYEPDHANNERHAKHLLPVI